MVLSYGLKNLEFRRISFRKFAVVFGTLGSRKFQYRVKSRKYLPELIEIAPCGIKQGCICRLRQIHYTMYEHLQKKTNTTYYDVCQVITTY